MDYSLPGASVHGISFARILEWVAIAFSRESSDPEIEPGSLALQETWVQPLGEEDPLEKEMATHSGILPWRIPWTEEPGRL